MASIRAAACTPFGQDQDPAQLVQQATDKCLKASPLTRADIDFLLVANAEAEAFCNIGNVSVWTATQARLAGTPSIRVDTGPSSGLAALSLARSLVDAGQATNVLVLGWEAMTNVPTEQATRILQGLMHPTEQAVDLSLPGLVAMLTSAYLDRYEYAIEDIAALPVKAHHLASNNPIAQFQNPITIEDVHASRIIADPLRLLHCAPLSDGASAVLVSRDGPVEIKATGHATDYHAYTQRRTRPWSFQATKDAANALFDQVPDTRQAVDVVELHDAFSILEAVNLEDLGLADDGQGLDALPKAGADPLAADPVVNPSGGLKARGHPVGATGLAQVTECVQQLTGQAANQIDDARLALVQSIGGFGNNVHCTLLEGGIS